MKSVFRPAILALIPVLLYFSNCSNQIIKSDITTINSPKLAALNLSYDSSSKIYKIEIDDIVILFRYADIGFLAEKFSFTVNINGTFKKQEIHCIPFYILQKNNGASSESGESGNQYAQYQSQSQIQSQSQNSDTRQSKHKSENKVKSEYLYKTGVTPFYISIKNNGGNKINVNLEKNAVIVDEHGRQYKSLSYQDLEKYKMNYTYRVKKKTGIIKQVMTPIFKYTGISMLTDMVAATPASKLSLFNVSINDVTKSVSEVKNLYDYEYSYPFAENLMFKTETIYPSVIESGFLVFPIIPDDVHKFKLIISDIITKYSDDGASSKTGVITVEMTKEE